MNMALLQKKEILIDSHAHLDGRAYDSDREEVIQRALAAGLQAIITIGVEKDLPGIEKAVAIADDHVAVFATVGVHPHDAQAIQEDWYDKIKALADHPKVVGIGETGLDYHYMHSPKLRQQGAFERFLCLGRDLDLPVVIHTREAEEDTLFLLNQFQQQGGGKSLYGVVHCFSGDYSLARKFLDMGLYLSFTGVITFPKAEVLRDVIKKIPLERVLLETDCPYLTPIPFRGKRNEPAHVVHVAKTVADILGKPLEEVAGTTTQNVITLFRLPI